MRIVTLGSGTGQATVLRGLQSYDCQVTAIVGVTDNGGHSGSLRRALRLPQVGDTRQCLGALVDETSIWGHLLRHRFVDGDLQGVSVGNLMLAALSTIHGRLSKAVAEVCRAAGIRQHILPVADTEADIAAELQDGRQLIGEWQIIQRQPRCDDIVRLFLHPPVAALPQVLDAIAAADVLVLCPGSFLTGTIAVLLHEGLRDAIASTPAVCLYVCNLMTQPGQTDGYTAGRHLAVLQDYLGRQVDGMILNDGVVPPALEALYAQHESYPVSNDMSGAEVAVYCADLVDHPDAATLRAYRRPQGQDMQVGLHLIRHDAHKLAAQIMALVSA